MYGFDEDGNPYLDATTYSFTYNKDGIRTSKTVNGVVHEYILNGDQITAEKFNIGIDWEYFFAQQGWFD